MQVGGFKVQVQHFRKEEMVAYGADLQALGHTGAGGD
jgi:hypothetical protein